MMRISVSRGNILKSKRQNARLLRKRIKGSQVCKSVLKKCNVRQKKFARLRSINPLHPANPLTGEPTIKNSQQR